MTTMTPPCQIPPRSDGSGDPDVPAADHKRSQCSSSPSPPTCSASGGVGVGGGHVLPVQHGQSHSSTCDPPLLSHHLLQAEQNSATVIKQSSIDAILSQSTDDGDDVSRLQRVFQPSTATVSVNAADSPGQTLSVPASSLKRGSGWGIPDGLGLRGGSDTMANGASGWGPPPVSSGANAGATAGAGSTPGGWGFAPPVNPSASAAWGTANVAAEDSANKATATVAGGKHSPPAAPTAQPSQPSTSWAAAAGKGLPVSVSNSNGTFGSGGNATASKQLEQLHSVREALFSQDGWGGSNVKQDTSWDIESRPSGQEAGSSSSAATAAPVKDTNVWVGSNGNQRDDGTDLWKTTLSGQPPAPKPQPASPWGHTPQNPADYRNWGDDDERAPSTSSNDAFWRPEAPSSQFSKSQGDGWRNDPHGNSGTVANTTAAAAAPAAPASSWNDPSHSIARDSRLAFSQIDPSGGGSGNSWGAAPNQRQANPGQWGGGPAPAPVRWDHDSPTLARRPHPPMEDPAGTSLWGGKVNYQPVQNTSSASKWQDMPNMPRGPPGPHQMMGGRLNGPKETWSQEPTPSSRGGGWGDESAVSKNGSWGDEATKRDQGNWGGGDNQWSKQPQNVMPQPSIRSSPSWDEPSAGNSVDSPGWGNPRNDLSKSKEVIWNSKQFKILCDMGFRKDEVESTLRATNLHLEDALEMLNPSRRLPGPHMEPPYGIDPSHDGIRGSFSGGGLPFGQEHGLTQPGLGSMTNPTGPGLHHNQPLPHKMVPNMAGGNPGAANIMPQQRQPSSQQPSAQQLRILVHQIQMAVQAGHLNPQILNQPLAPQTLILLNQLLQQIKHLQSLQQQHSIAARGNTSSQALMNVTVSITKTKQHIQNLQNQISAQQANYLKSVPHSQSQPSTAEPTSTVQEMFNGLNLMGGDSPTTSNGSRLAQWKLPKEFPKAPGSGTTKAAPSSATLLLDNGSWGRSSEANGGWPEPDKNRADSEFGIPEFEPGKPWKGTGMKNPDDDPNLTPGSVAALPIGTLSKAGPGTGGLSAGNPGSDGNALGLTSPTNTWTFGNSKPKGPSGGVHGPHYSGGSSLTQIGQDLWGGKSNSGHPPPPGLTSNNPNSPWPQSSNGWSAENNSGSSGSAWLLLKNLTPQIDGSTLKTLCMQHGPLQHFDLYLNHSIALVMYATNREAVKAQKALNNCLLGNTTIHANTTSENDISAILQQLGVSTNQQPSSGGSSGAGGGSGTPTRGNTPSNPLLGKFNDMWNEVPTSSGASNLPPVTAGSSLFASGSVWGVPEAGSTLHSFLPGDLVDNM